MSSNESAPTIQPERFAETGPLKLAGLSQSYTVQTAGAIPQQWERFRPHIGHVPGQVGGVTYGACLRVSEPPDHRFDYVTAVEVADFSALPAELARVDVAPSTCAVFAHRDHISKLKQTLDAIFGLWMPASGYRMASGAPGTLTMLERYASFDVEKGTGDVEVWVPVEKAGS